MKYIHYRFRYRRSIRRDTAEERVYSNGWVSVEGRDWWFFRKSERSKYMAVEAKAVIQIDAFAERI